MTLAPVSALADSYHRAIDAVLGFTGMSDKLAHVHTGLAIYVCAQLAFRDRRGSAHALKAVVILEFANECMDRLFWGAWRWDDTISDVVATLFWPATLALASRYRRRLWARRVARLEVAIQTNPLNAMVAARN